MSSKEELRELLSHVNKTLLSYASIWVSAKATELSPHRATSLGRIVGGFEFHVNTCRQTIAKVASRELFIGLSSVMFMCIRAQITGSSSGMCVLYYIKVLFNAALSINRSQASSRGVAADISDSSATMDDAEKSRQLQNRLLVDAIHGIRLEALSLAKKLKESHSISRSEHLRPTKASVSDQYGESYKCYVSWPLWEVVDFECDSCAQSARSMASRPENSEIASTSKKSRTKEKNGSMNKGKVTSNNESAQPAENRELTRKKAVLAAAAFERWAAEKTPTEVISYHGLLSLNL
ncbi:hypothetical protein AXG93_131s1300 [Marchantia polymorpha subsp. ruderalis]|uniref:Uncharacterized protein n=1 Tax=Marchantia polymorpha subsp. ruderalis TaxID=1480154 RepID=A0A176W026_MARPO|nr:hypothetical protein AXG93_131s1300 [Marchantia polymorpha subsp. ruderalis]